jgi:hypothetical protein
MAKPARDAALKRPEAAGRRIKWAAKLSTRLVQLHEQLHEQLHNFNSQTATSLPNSLDSFSENALSQS